MNNKGFTLVELIAVISIIAIISFIAVFGISKYLEKSYDKQLKIIRNTIEDATDNYRVSHTLAKDTDINLSLLNPEYLDNINYRRDTSCILNNAAGRIKYITQDEYIHDLETQEKEYYCIYFSCNGNVLIDDYTDKEYCSNN